MERPTTYPHIYLQHLVPLQSAVQSQNGPELRTMLETTLLTRCGRVYNEPSFAALAVLTTESSHPTKTRFFPGDKLAPTTHTLPKSAKNILYPHQA